MKLTIEERYALSHLEHTFVDVYERNKWSSSKHPLEMFSELKNPNSLNIELELEMFEESINKKYKAGSMKRDQWHSSFQTWLLKTKRKDNSKPNANMEQPLYMVMYNDLVKRSFQQSSWDTSLEERYWKMWNWLTKKIESRGPEDTGSHNKHTKEWMEMVCRNPNMTAAERDSYYQRIIFAVLNNKFDDKFLLYIAAHSAGLLIDIMDIKYPAERDKKDLCQQMLAVTNRIERKKYDI